MAKWNRRTHDAYIWFKRCICERHNYRRLVVGGQWIPIAPMTDDARSKPDFPGSREIQRSPHPNKNRVQGSFWYIIAGFVAWTLGAELSFTALSKCAQL